jgi:hypothetical protein
VPSPVHSAHVGDEVEVHYRWHPYFGQKVCIRRVEQRATGQYLQISISATLKARGSAGATKIPTACCDNTFRRAPISASMVPMS